MNTYKSNIALILRQITHRYTPLLQSISHLLEYLKDEQYCIVYQKDL